MSESQTRAEFENYASDDGNLLAIENMWDRDTRGDYLSPFMQAAWRAWQFARREALEEAAKVCDVTPPYPFRPSIEAAHAIRLLLNPNTAGRTSKE